MLAVHVTQSPSPQITRTYSTARPTGANFILICQTHVLILYGCSDRSAFSDHSNTPRLQTRIGRRMARPKYINIFFQIKSFIKQAFVSIHKTLFIYLWSFSLIWSFVQMVEPTDIFFNFEMQKCWNCIEHILALNRFHTIMLAILSILFKELIQNNGLRQKMHLIHSYTPCLPTLCLWRRS